jgi:predicted CXXCH cytochrome family protein
MQACASGSRRGGPLAGLAYSGAVGGLVPFVALIVSHGLALAAPPADASPPSYVGSATCAPCHASQHRSWRGSDHDRAMEKADETTVLGDFHDATFAHFGATSRFFRRDGKFLVRTEGPDGKMADFEIRYTFGVDPLQQYLIEFPNGRLQSLTLAWDARPAEQGGQRWFALYPNERIVADDPLHWTGPQQNWNYMCASCHSTDLRKRYDAKSNGYATSWSEIDVACEACHGPGSRHVAWASAHAGGTPSSAPADRGLSVDLAPAGGGRWVIDPQTGSARPTTATNAAATLGVCAPCHARRSVIAERYRPGQPFLDAYLPALLTPGLYHTDGQIDGEVYEYGSFLQSRMYRSGVGCTDCHDPHSLKLRADGNALCAQCHLASKFDRPEHHFHRSGSSGAQCVGCHMPARPYMIVDPRRDHSLRVPRPDLSVEIGTPNACTQCHGDRTAAWARDRVREWYGRDARGSLTFAAALHAGRVGGPNAAELLAALVTDPAQPAIARATALALLCDRLSPTTLAALDAGLRDADGLVRRAAVVCLDDLPAGARVARAAPLLNDPLRAVRVEAARVLAALPAANLDPTARGRLERGVAEYVAAQEVDADRPEARTNLGTLYAQRGQVAQAEAEFNAAIALQRGYAPAYVNLADLYRVEQRDADGERVLRAGIAAAPQDAALRHALGLLLVRQKRLPEAIEALERAAALRPDDAYHAYVLGVALNSSGQSDRALTTLSAAAARHPFDPQLLLALATINRDRGERAAALEYARRLAKVTPGDPAAAQLVAELSRPGSADGSADTPE